MATKKTSTTKKSKAKSNNLSKKSKKSETNKESRIISAKSFSLKVSSYTEQTRILQILSVPIYVGLAIAVWFQMASTTFPITLSHQAKNILASSNSTEFTPAFHVIYDIQLRYCVIVTLIIMTSFAALSALKMPKVYAQAVSKKVNPWRWITVGIVGSILVNITSLLNGLSDIIAIKVSSLIILTAAVVAWQVERQHTVNSKAPKITAPLAIFLALLSMASIVAAMVGTYFFGLIRSPWYVYASTAVLLLATVNIILNQVMYIKGKKNWKDYSFIDRNAQITVFIAVIAISIVLISGLAK